MDELTTSYVLMPDEVHTPGNNSISNSSMGVSTVSELARSSSSSTDMSPQAVEREMRRAETEAAAALAIENAAAILTKRRESEEAAAAAEASKRSAEAEAEAAVAAVAAAAAKKARSEKLLAVPFLLAAQTGQVEALSEHLTVGGQSAEMKDEAGWSALQWAAFENHKDCCALLLSHNAKVDAQNKKGCTALYFAASKGHKDVIQMLLDRGADINVIADSKFTPYTVALQNFGPSHDVVKLLCYRTAKPPIVPKEKCVIS